VTLLSQIGVVGGMGRGGKNLLLPLLPEMRAKPTAIKMIGQNKVLKSILKMRSTKKNTPTIIKMYDAAFKYLLLCPMIRPHAIKITGQLINLLRKYKPGMILSMSNNIPKRIMSKPKSELLLGFLF
jgi:hypothetical protein